MLKAKVHTVPRCPTPGWLETAAGVGEGQALAPEASVGRCAGYQGRGKRWAEEVLGLSVEVVRKPQKPIPEKVAKAWAEEWAKEGKQMDW